MSKKRTAGYQSYGSKKGTWKLWVMCFLTPIGGVIVAVAVADLIARLGGLAALLLCVEIGFFSVAIFAVCTKKSWFWGMVICAELGLLMLYQLNITARLDILAGVTLIKGGTHILLLLMSIVLTAAIGTYLLSVSSGPTSKPSWLPVIAITVLMIYPSVSNSINAINVAADGAATKAAVGIVTQTRSESRLLSAGRRGSTYEYIHYATVAENALIAEEMEFKVGKELYATLQPGDQVNIVLHSGALGMPWTEVVSAE